MSFLTKTKLPDSLIWGRGVLNGRVYTRQCSRCGVLFRTMFRRPVACEHCRKKPIPEEYRVKE
jgi:uncharacterized OB-fold protein